LYCKLIENKLFSFFVIYEICRKSLAQSFVSDGLLDTEATEKLLQSVTSLTFDFLANFFEKTQLFFQNLNCNYQTERVCQEAREETFGKNGLQKELERQVNPLGADVDEEINQKIRHCCNKVEIQFTI